MNFNPYRADYRKQIFQTTVWKIDLREPGLKSFREIVETINGE